VQEAPLLCQLSSFVFSRFLLHRRSSQGLGFGGLFWFLMAAKIAGENTVGKIAEERIPGRR